MSSFVGLNYLIPGSYSMVRQFNGDTAGAFVAENFRSLDWFGSCPQLTAAQQSAAMARGELRAITISVTAGTTDLAEEAAPDVPPNANRFMRAANASNVETMTRRFTNANNVSTLFLRLASAAGQIEVWFDIPTAAQV